MRYLFQTVLILFGFVANAQHSDPLLRHYRQAETFANEQRFDEALHEYQKVLQLDANFAEVYSGMGLVYWKTGRVQEKMNFTTFDLFWCGSINGRQTGDSALLYFPVASLEPVPYKETLHNV